MNGITGSPVNCITNCVTWIQSVCNIARTKGEQMAQLSCSVGGVSRAIARSLDKGDRHSEPERSGGEESLE